MTASSGSRVCLLTLASLCLFITATGQLFPLRPPSPSPPVFGGPFPPGRDTSGTQEGPKPSKGGSQGPLRRVICLFNDGLQRNLDANRVSLLDDLMSAWRGRIALCPELFSNQFLPSLGIELFSVRDETQYACLRDLLRPYQNMVTCTPSFLMTSISQTQASQGGFLGNLLSPNGPSGDIKTTERMDFQWFRQTTDELFGGVGPLQDVLNAYQGSEYARRAETSSDQAPGRQRGVLSSFIGTGMDFFIEAMAPMSMGELGGASWEGVANVQEAAEVEKQEGRPADQLVGDVFFRNNGEIPHNGIDDDGNGFVDDFVGYDFTKPPQKGGSGYSEAKALASGVGTHDTAAGVLYAGNCDSKVDTKDTTTSVKGIGCNAKLFGIAPLAMPLKVWDEEKGGADLADVLAAIEYSVQQRASMAYLALGFGEFPSSQQAKAGPHILKTAMQRASRFGHVFFIPCGNEGIQPQLQSTPLPTLQGSKTPVSLKNYLDWNLCDVPGAALLCVCSIDAATGKPTDYTNIPFITRNVLWAPGSLLTLDSSGQQTTYTGTSLATASVLGTAAMVQAALGDMVAPDMLLASLLSGNRRIFTPGQVPAMPLFKDYAQSWFNFQQRKKSARDVRRRRLQGIPISEIPIGDIIGAGAQLAGQMAGAISAGQGQQVGQQNDPAAALLSALVAANGAAPQGSVNCFTDNTVLDGGTVIDRPTAFNTAAACQAVCEQTLTPVACTKFSFRPPNECTLFSNPTGQFSSPGTVSGPAVCQNDQGAQNEQASGGLAGGLANAGGIFLPGAAAPFPLGTFPAALAGDSAFAQDLPALLSTGSKALSTGLNLGMEVAKYVDVGQVASLALVARDAGVVKRLPVPAQDPNLKLESLPPAGSGRPKVECFNQGMKCCIPLVALNGQYEGAFAPAYLSGTEQCKATLRSDIFTDPNDFGGDVCATAIFKGEGSCGMRVYRTGDTILYENELRHQGANNNVICRCWVTTVNDTTTVRGEATWEVTVQAANGETGEGDDLGYLGEAAAVAEFLGSDQGQAAMTGAGQLLNQFSEGVMQQPGANPIEDYPFLAQINGGLDFVNEGVDDALNIQSVDDVDNIGGKVAVTFLNGARIGAQYLSDYMDSKPAARRRRRLLQVEASQVNMRPKCSAWMWVDHVYARRSHCEEAPLEYQASNDKCAPVELIKDGCPVTAAIDFKLCGLSCGVLCFRLPKLRWWDGVVPYRLHTRFVTYPSIPALRSKLEAKCPDFLNKLLQSNEPSLLPQQSARPARRRRLGRGESARPPAGWQAVVIPEQEPAKEPPDFFPPGPPSKEDSKGLPKDPLGLLPEEGAKEPPGPPGIGDLPFPTPPGGPPGFGDLPPFPTGIPGDLPIPPPEELAAFFELISEEGPSLIGLIDMENIPPLNPSGGDNSMAALGAFLGVTDDMMGNLPASPSFAGLEFPTGEDAPQLTPEGTSEELGVVTFNQNTGIVASAVVDEDKTVQGPVYVKQGAELAEVLANPELIKWQYDVANYTFDQVVEVIPKADDDAEAVLDEIQREQSGLGVPPLET